MRGSIYKIAIDGPVGAGKSTVAKKVSEKLGILYVDTGAMYRAVAYFATKNKVDWRDKAGIVKLLPKIKIELERPEGKENDGRNVTVLLGDEDVSWEIRKGNIGEGASIVSSYPEVRDKLVEMQREMASRKSVIMEGRDIGTRVLPDAQLKIYMDADLKERAKRKVGQFKRMGEKVSLKDAKDEIVSRDSREMNRKIDPLRPAKGAWMFDTTDLSVSQVVDRIVERVARDKGNF